MLCWEFEVYADSELTAGRFGSMQTPKSSSVTSVNRRHYYLAICGATRGDKRSPAITVAGGRPVAGK